MARKGLPHLQTALILTDRWLPAEADKEEGANLAETADDIYSDLYDAQGEQGTLLKSKYAAVRSQHHATHLSFI